MGTVGFPTNNTKWLRQHEAFLGGKDKTLHHPNTFMVNVQQTIKKQQKKNWLYVLIQAVLRPLCTEDHIRNNWTDLHSHYRQLCNAEHYMTRPVHCEKNG